MDRMATKIERSAGDEKAMFWQYALAEFLMLLLAGLVIYATPENNRHIVAGMVLLALVSARTVWMIKLGRKLLLIEVGLSLKD